MREPNNNMGTVLDSTRIFIDRVKSDGIGSFGYTLTVIDKNLSDFDEFQSLSNAFENICHGGPKLIIIDLTNVKGLTSYMLGNLINLQEIAKRTGSVLLLSNLNEEAYTVVELLGLTDYFNIITGIRDILDLVKIKFS